MSWKKKVLKSVGKIVNEKANLISRGRLFIIQESLLRNRIHSIHFTKMGTLVAVSSGRRKSPELNKSWVGEDCQIPQY